MRFFIRLACISIFSIPLSIYAFGGVDKGNYQSGNAENKEDSTIFRSDTARIADLLDRAERSDEAEQKLALARRAYNLATDDTPPEYRYKAAAYYGYHRSYESLEEGVELLNRGFTGFWEAHPHFLDDGRGALAVFGFGGEAILPVFLSGGVRKRGEERESDRSRWMASAQWNAR